MTLEGLRPDDLYYDRKLLGPYPYLFATPSCQDAGKSQACFEHSILKTKACLPVES